MTGRGTCLLVRYAKAAGISAAVPTTLESITVQRADHHLYPGNVRDSCYDMGIGMQLCLHSSTHLQMTRLMREDTQQNQPDSSLAVTHWTCVMTNQCTFSQARGCDKASKAMTSVDALWSNSVLPQYPVIACISKTGLSLRRKCFTCLPDSRLSGGCHVYGCHVYLP